MNFTGDAPGRRRRRVRRGRRAGTVPAAGDPASAGHRGGWPPWPARSRGSTVRRSWPRSTRPPGRGPSKACSATTSWAPAARSTVPRPTPHRLRLFVEGVPTSETANQTAIRQGRSAARTTGPSRQLARFRQQRGPAGDATDMNIWTVWRARPLSCGGSDHVSFLQQGYPAGPVHRGAGELQPRAQRRPGDRRRPARRPGRVLRRPTTSPGSPR